MSLLHFVLCTSPTVQGRMASTCFASGCRPLCRIDLKRRSFVLARCSLQKSQQEANMHEEIGLQPSVAWTRKLDAPAHKLKEFKPTIREIYKMLGFIGRLWKYSRDERSRGRRAPIDPFVRQGTPSSSQGVPLGGIGGGSIGRGWKGDFMRWQLSPGVCEHSSEMANQFSVAVTRHKKSGKREKFSSVLYAGKPDGKIYNAKTGISSWSWKLNGQKCTYHGLFPRAWTIYDGEPDPELKITCRQVSPFIPHNYRESSYPSCVFVYDLVNTGEEDADVTLVFTWANSTGSSAPADSYENAPFKETDGVQGVLLRHRADNESITFAIAAKETADTSISICPIFMLSGNADSMRTAKDLWMEIEQRGSFSESKWSSSAAPGSDTAAAVAASVRVPASGKKVVSFGLAWDAPTARFLDGRCYNRRYTKYYGKSGNAASKLVRDALRDHNRWEAEIEAWQGPILKDESLPKWYRYTLFNELYYLVAGGTVWTENGGLESNSRTSIEAAEVPKTLLKAVKSNDHSRPWHLPLPAENDVGRLLYLEGVEYRFWNTYDVHFYASPALLSLFPKLELGLQRDFAAATLSHDPEEIFHLAHGNRSIRSVFGAVPHDLGTHDPWIKVNSYNFYDTNRWKDLNSKFVIQVYRDVAATSDKVFARAVWPAVYAAIAYADQFDKDRDGMIENDGFPDQTYDLWTTEGVSAYCGGLWVAALQAASAMAAIVGDTNSAILFNDKFLRAKKVFEEALWNGSYYKYDCSSSGSSSSVQSDQLAGQWYTLASGLPPIVDPSKAASALQKVFAFNIMQVHKGTMGAVNGMQPDGQVDKTCLQSREVWTGSTYALAALMIHHGMREEGFKVAEGVFLNSWSEQGQGYAFQTPEAWTTDGRYRALAYMRPLSIWAMQWALHPPSNLPQAPSFNGQDYSDSAFSEVATLLKKTSQPSKADL